MGAPRNFAWSFIDVAVFSEDRVYLTAAHDDSSSKNIPVSSVLRWNGKWASRSFGIAAVSLCVVTHPERTVLTLGHDGKVVRWGSRDFSEEHIDPSSDGPGVRGGMREIRAIGKHAYAVGMGRMVYRCDGESQWSRIDHGMRADIQIESDAGFNSIDGFDEEELYAVGWNGEIWSFDQKQWRRQDSPTRLALHRVVCAPDGQVYALGQRGLILRGRHGQWTTIERDGMQQDFWGGCWFNGRLYASTANGVFVLNGNTLEKVDTGKIRKSRSDCFYRLSSSSDCLWSVGEKMAIYSRDGETWKEVSYR